jgi:hypothetical protein
LPSSHPEFGRVGEPWWNDRPVAIVGTGPSLKSFDFGRLRGPWHVLAVKQAYHDLPFADTCFGLDLPWMAHHAVELADLALRMPLILAVPSDHAQCITGALYVRREVKCEGLSDDLDWIEAGQNSGYGAVNLAYLKRAKRIVLFGYDYGGEHYCEERYVTRPKDHNARYMPGWAANFRWMVKQLAAAGVDVVNASPLSRIDAFTKCTIDEGLARLG